LLQFLFNMYSVNVFDNIFHHRLLKLVRDMLLGNGSILKDPLIVKGLFGTDSLVGVVGQHSFNQKLSFPGYAQPLRLRKLKFSGLDFFEDLSMILALERRRPAEENVHNDAATPNVTFFVIHAIEYLRCDVIGGTKFMTHFGVRIENYRSTKVYDLYEIYLIALD